MNYKVAMLIGSESDRKTVEHSLPYFKYFGINCEIKVISAHRNPDKVAKFSKNARNEGYKIYKSIILNDMQNYNFKFQ